jgi:hypothetical protein
LIIFVYNADSGKLNAAFDIAHKLLSPATYNCQICNLTYGVLSENEIWKDFREQASEELVFLHRDEFKKQYAENFAYPVVLRKVENDLQELLPADEIEKLIDIEDLIARIRKVINE